MKEFFKRFLIGLLIIILCSSIAFYGYYVGFCFSVISTAETIWRGIVAFLLNSVQTIFLIIGIWGIGSLIYYHKGT